ncbi:hydrogenase [Pseudomonas sp. GD04087]|uniref:hydrogenase n=1 Tax=unclassified Pseudomonas TaxID=196821 RepID=UPI00244C2ABA|nr:MULTISPECIES: hydrogenase [unclassified Pseudomonas]MDH0288929.1 hydrogenase [Pseudomonas sp. GD04087]MDH1051268.1 hydrogenase [Pseudomonas sp. GD03903]MDH1999206.1 hydrogenase [Pseudomonas sp. GD03691]
MNQSSASLPPTSATPEAPPLINRLVEQFAASWVGLDTLDVWLAQPGEALLLLCGDPVRHPECLDVAVILPELCKTLAERHDCHPRLGIGRRVDEAALAERFALRRWPSIIWLRDGGYVTQIDGIRDWDAYLHLAESALQQSNALIPLRSNPIQPSPGECQ